MIGCALKALLCAQGKIKDSWDLLPAFHIFFSSYYDLPFSVLITVSLETDFVQCLGQLTPHILLPRIKNQKAFPNYLSYPLRTNANHDIGDAGPHLILQTQHRV